MPCRPEAPGREWGRVALLLLALAMPAAARENGRADETRALRVPSVVLTDETGRTVRLYDDLVKGRIVVMNFVFTACSTICQPMSATFAQVQKMLGPRPVRLVTVSIDPEHDTPARLAEWKARFGGGDSWALLTGAKDEIDRLRKTLGVYTANRLDHTPTIVLLDDRSGRSTRLNGLVRARDVIAAIDSLTGAASARDTPDTAPAQEEGAGKYFRGLSLVDQDGRAVRLYEDVIAGHVVVLHTFFASCQGTCPVLTGTLVHLQKRFADRLGGPLRFVSITVDPQNDTPQKLREHAARVQARPGWLFLTGSPAQVDAALRKIGQYAPSPESHTNVMIIGNEPTGLWKKVFGLSAPESIGDLVQGVLDDGAAESGR